MSFLVAILLASAPELAERLGAAVDRAGRGRVTVGAAVRDLDSGDLVFERAADEPLIPASNAKLFTAAAALFILGADFEFETGVYVAGGVLHVDAAGDPNISGRFHDGDPTAVFRGWARALRDAGIDRVDGIVLHNSIFDAQVRHPDWERYNPAVWYAAPVGAFSLNDNCVDVTITAGAAGSPPGITVSPPNSHVRIANRAMTVESEPAAAERLVWNRDPGSRTITFSRSMWARGPPESYSIAVDDPSSFFAAVLRDVLVDEGVAVEDEIVESTAAIGSVEGARRIAVHRSELAPTLQVCLSRSQNLYAELLCKRVGCDASGLGSFDSGTAAIEEWARSIGCRNTDLADGSGLSRGNRTTARDVVTLLAALDGNDMFRDALARPGEDGTMRRRLTGDETANRVWAKTGTLSGATALSGYVIAPSGRRYAFSVIANGRDANEGIADAVVQVLCRE